MKPKIFVFTNGYKGTWPSIQYGAWLAKNMQTSLVLTGIIEHMDRESFVEEIFSRSVSHFQEQGIEYDLLLEEQNAEDAVVQAAANDSPERLIVFGPFGRPHIRRLVVGRSFRHIMAESRSPILYVPALRLPLKHVLVCMGGLGYAVTVENLAISMAQVSGANVTLLTVVPPVELDYPEARFIQKNWRTLSQTDTLPGRVLRTALRNARAAGVRAVSKTRHGNVIEEIMREIKEGDYDLVCMGSPYSTQSLRHLYTPNATADVAESAQCPILTARYMEDEVPAVEAYRKVKENAPPRQQKLLK